MATELELTSDNLRDTHWLGEVMDNKDPLNNGRCRVKVYGKFDTLPTEAIPWATPMTRDHIGSHHTPNIGDIVAVRFDNGNMYHPEYWFQVNQNKDLKKDVLDGAEKPHNVVSILYDPIRNVRIYYSLDDGYIMTVGKDNKAQPMIRFDKDGKMFIFADNIFVSNDKNDESEPTAKGETLRKMLESFLKINSEHKHPTPSGISNAPINAADFNMISDDLEVIKHTGSIMTVQMSEEQIAAADTASLNGGSISSSTLSGLSSNPTIDKDASKKLQKQIDSYDDKSITVKSGSKKPKSVPQSLIKAMKAYGITTPLQRAHFLAQCAHESGEFKWREEFASGAAYEGRKDLGNTQPGDGVKFKGRGFVQITGRANYKQFSKYCGEDLTINPKALAIKYAADTATWFWQTRNLNKYAVDDSLASIKAITRRINGGFNGLQDRVNRFQDYWAILKDDPTAFT